MERGAQTLIKVILAAVLIGVLVIVFNDDYRAAFHALRAGRSAESPIWQGNRDYYPGIGAGVEASR